jgi:RNA polymerase sigma factor (sigma-70 family)
MPAAATLEREDQELAVRFRDGDPEAVRDLYRRYSGALFTIARSMLADHEHANDAVQQTFLQAWKAAHRVDADRPLSSWLYQICRRVCIDRYRAERKAAEALTSDGEVTDSAIDGPSIDETWTAFEVRRAIDALPEEEREVIRLSHLESWSYARIAEKLAVPVGTVKSRAFRAHRKLASALAHLDDRASVDEGEEW